MHRLFAALIALAISATALAAESGHPPFPSLTTKDLNGRELSFPSGLPGKRTLVLVAFHRRQQANLDVWIDKLGLKGTDAPAWIEMPVVPNYGRIWRNFVDNGMRSGIVTPQARARVFTVYGSRDDFRAKLDMPTDEQVYILVVTKQGKVVARADGDYTAAKAATIRKAIAGG